MGLKKAVNSTLRVQKGQGNISSADQVLGVDEKAITPDNPGTFNIFRSVPVLTQPRKFTHQEADALVAHAGKSTIQAEATRKAMRAMRQIKTADTTVQTSYNQYRTHEAKKTLEQVQSNAQTANAINGLRSAYGLAYQSVAGSIQAENAKQQAIFSGEQAKKKEFSKLW